ncbi:aldehyde dehydrogenase [Hyphococcus luteus]|uniref:Aldehyde dehydrogenase n=1 Tax=Hyphococcus luteus TaxID=2058213 RepID=A0A2S7K0P2_9PROT|nr:aldehyde dehydrogenase [Marinicaulis flavus]PQA86072.1 aldehyde dehydrogenase [Marinicaulis flavus]
MSDMLLPDGVTIRNPDKIFIGGAWASPSTDKTITLIDPNTEQPVGRVAEAVEADMDRAVEAARKAFDEGPWPATPPAERAKYLHRLAEALKKREPELARAWTAQVGALSTIAPFIIGGGTASAAHMASVTESYAFETHAPSSEADTAVIVREPVGVVAAIAPWNAPYTIMLSKVAAALSAGCTVIMKPSPETPLDAYIIAEVAEEIGLPPGVVNLVCGDRAASDHLVCNHGVDKVSFTGSTVAGKRIASVCGERIARCTLELGGKSAAIVRDDYSTEEAAKLLSSTITVFSGQVCAMLSRAIVPRKRHDELADAIAGEMKKIKIGPSTDPETQLGPLAMGRQRDRVEGYIEKGKETADLVTGGQRPSHMNRGYFIEPTLFANVDNSSVIAQEEIFGPVLSLIPCEDEEDAVRIANESNYGLNGSVLTHDHEAAYRIARRVRAGGVAQNGMKADFNLPFGGFKQSGIGREGGAEGLAAYLETKTILLDGRPSKFN